MTDTPKPLTGVQQQIIIDQAKCSTPKLTRIVRHDTPYCEAHHRYHTRRADGSEACPICLPVCRMERDEGLDLFNPEKKNG